MRGVNSEIGEHRLEVDPSFKPVRQKLRIFARDKKEAIKEEVNKLLKAGIIREIYYLTWLANVVMVKKANEK